MSEARISSESIRFLKDFAFAYYSEHEGPSESEHKALDLAQALGGDLSRAAQAAPDPIWNCMCGHCESWADHGGGMGWCSEHNTITVSGQSCKHARPKAEYAEPAGEVEAPVAEKSCETCVEWGQRGCILRQRDSGPRWAHCIEAGYHHWKFKVPAPPPAAPEKTCGTCDEFPGPGEICERRPAGRGTVVDRCTYPCDDWSQCPKPTPPPAAPEGECPHYDPCTRMADDPVCKLQPTGDEGLGGEAHWDCPWSFGKRDRCSIRALAADRDRQREGLAAVRDVLECEAGNEAVIAAEEHRVACEARGENNRLRDDLATANERADQAESSLLAIRKMLTADVSADPVKALTECLQWDNDNRNVLIREIAGMKERCAAFGCDALRELQERAEKAEARAQAAEKRVEGCFRLPSDTALTGAGWVLVLRNVASVLRRHEDEYGQAAAMCVAHLADAIKRGAEGGEEWIAPKGCSAPTGR